VLREDGILIPTTNNAGAPKPPRQDAAGKSREYVRRHWKYSEPALKSSGSCRESGSGCTLDSFTVLIDRIQSHSLCISGMAFQDAWNIDLERLQRCCVHVATAQKQLIPFCAYYMTDSNGRRLIDRIDGLLLK
jgi:7,8-dihydro-6-hydroxymethylpterin dimethyltransferase